MFAAGREHERARFLLYGGIEEGDPFYDQAWTAERTALDRLFFQAGVTLRERSFTLWRCCGSLVIAAFGCVLLDSGLPLMVVPAHICVEYLRLRLKVSKRVNDFDKDYTALLLSLSSAVKTGMDPMSALLLSRDLFEPTSEMYNQLQALNEASEQGDGEEDVLNSFAKGIAHPDLGLFRTAFIMARQEGSSLANCLWRLAKVTRQRQSFRRKVKAAVAMQKLSAYAIAGCAGVIVSMQVASNPELIEMTLNHPMGKRVLVLGTLLMVLGLAWMMKIANCED